MSTDTQIPVSQLYRWSAWLHVGPKAESCEAVNEEAGTNDCQNPLHFHAFCRLPNQFAHRVIREEALAAKARRVRLLRDPDSNPAVILEDELDSLARRGDAAKEEIVNELVGQDWWRDFLEATAEVRETENDDGSKPFEHIDIDIAKFQREAGDTPVDELSEELQALNGHIMDYNERVDAAQEELARPRREALMARDVNDLLDMVRDQRIDLDSNEAFSHEYATLQWLTCTFHKPGGQPVFTARDALERADSAVLDGLKDLFIDLEKTKQQGGGPGNS